MKLTKDPDVDEWQQWQLQEVLLESQDLKHAAFPLLAMHALILT